MFKTLSKRFRKPKSPESSSSSQRSQSIASSINVPQADASIATTPSDAQDNRTKRENSNGLILLSDTSQLKGKEGTLDVDIVAIHGLNGGAYSTWEHENSESWLEKSLPSAVPGARIYTYGYPSQLFFSKSMATLQDYSRRLLASLVYLAEDDRPIIFICHSLGGIVCKQALVIAHDENHRYGRILSATSSIVFFGTPHRGAHGVADVGKAVGAVLNACLLASQTSGITGTTRTDLLKTLESNSDSLKNLSTSFRNRLNTLEIVTFYETRTAPMLRDLVVEKESAIMEVQNEELIPLYADHMSMCRLPDKTEACVLVVNVIRRLAREASKDRENARKKRISSERCM